MSEDLGRRLLDALGRKDAGALKALLRPDVDFRAMTPRRFWEADDRDTVVDDILLGKWFAETDEITGIDDLETATVAATHRVGYTVRVTNADGPQLVAQQAYFESDGETIGWLRIMCAGYRPAT